MIIPRHNPYGSPNQAKPTVIVVHAMAEFVLADDGKTYIHAPDFLESEGLSAHVLAAPDGTLYRCREDLEGAYHARGFNVDSLGIEVMLAGRHDYSSFVAGIAQPLWCIGPQYAAVVQQVREWMRLHGISRVVRHSDLSPGRKLDPGMGFPWTKFLADLKK
jgi:N-acetyl-anhydromuramyl-L-alanine amidase AmpD